MLLEPIDVDSFHLLTLKDEFWDLMGQRWRVTAMVRTLHLFGGACELCVSITGIFNYGECAVMAGHSKSIGDYASLCCDGDKSMSSRISCLFRESKALPYRIRPCCAQSDLINVNLATSQRNPPSSENILRPNPVLLSILPNPLQILVPI